LKTILVVEDDLAVRNGIRRILERAGYAVITASTALEAMERAAGPETPIDLLLTDFVLPDATGRQLADVLAGARPGLRVLYISGYDEADIAAHRHGGPGAAFLRKPFAVNALLEWVEVLLGGDGETKAAAGGEQG